MLDDPILAELRKVREEMLVEFPTDDALFRAMKDHQAERIRQGKTVASPSPSAELKIRSADAAA